MMSRDEAIKVLNQMVAEWRRIADTTSAPWLKEQKIRMAEAARMGAEALEKEAGND